MFISIYIYRRIFLISKEWSFNLEIKSLNMKRFDKYIWIVNSREIIELWDIFSLSLISFFFCSSEKLIMWLKYKYNRIYLVNVYHILYISTFYSIYRIVCISFHTYRMCHDNSFEYNNFNYNILHEILYFIHKNKSIKDHSLFYNKYKHIYIVYILYIV